jgi:DNA polymerase
MHIRRDEEPSWTLPTMNPPQHERLYDPSGRLGIPDSVLTPPTNPRAGRSNVGTSLVADARHTVVMTDSRQLRKAALDRKIKACRKCVHPDRLNEPGATESAPGFGSIDSHVAIVGEALCRACMEKQEPFYRGSGRVLERCFKRAGVDKTDLFITNSIHCHPPDDRDPYPHESANCLPFLRAELRDIVRPRLVIGVGKFARVALLQIYPEARQLTWPFRVPRPRRADPPDIAYLLFPKHPYFIMTRPPDVREDYERRLARAIEWGFTTT